MPVHREGSERKSTRENRNSHQSITTEFACEPGPCSTSSRLHPSLCDPPTEGGEEVLTQSELWGADAGGSKRWRKVCRQSSEVPGRPRAESLSGLSNEQCHQQSRVASTEVEPRSDEEGTKPKSSHLIHLPALYISPRSDKSLNLSDVVDLGDIKAGQQFDSRIGPDYPSKLSNAERLLSPLRLQSPPLAAASSTLLQLQQHVSKNPISRSRTFRSLTSIAPEFIKLT